MAIQTPARRVQTIPVRRDGLAKVTGEAKYTDDFAVAGAWFGATVRSTEPHARLLAIDRRTDDGFDWSTVVVVTAADIPGDNVVSSLVDDQPILVPIGGEIRHRAEPIALVAAPDHGTARAAVARIVARTERLPPVFDPLESRQEIARSEITKGDVDAAMAAADLILEGEYRTGHQEQLYIEGQAMIALPREDGGVELHGSMQCPYYVHGAIKRGMALSDEQARIVQEETGGGFGGKEDFPSLIGLHAALLARKARRPVRMIYDRHEDIVATTKRHPPIARHRTGGRRDGTRGAQDGEVVSDAGAYTTLSPVVLSRAALHSAGPYHCPNVRIRARAMATNTAPNGAFRGFGAPQVAFAVETHLNRIADALGLGQLDIRRRNAYRTGDETPPGQVLHTADGAHAVLERAAEAAEFGTVRARDPGRPTAGERVASGIGLALGWHGAGFTGRGEVKLASVAGLELTADGRIRILVASVEMGQGARTVLPMLVAEALGLPFDAVEVAPPDTAFVPNSGPTVASRTTMIVGDLLIRAARKLRARVEGESGGRSFAETYQAWAAGHGRTRIDERFEPYPGVPFDDATYRGDAYPDFSWGACVAEVDVDLDTGEVTVRDVVAVDEAGRVVHPVLAAGQVEGGTLQAIGYATIEEMKLDDGRYLNDRLATYLIPTALDAPRITTVLLEEPFPHSAHGAKGLGELPMNVAAPAVVAAIADATGVWITELPATPERILAALAAASMGTVGAGS